MQQVAGRGKVIVGASADGVRTCIEYSREAKTLGAAAVMVSPPRMLKLNTESVVNHYKALADAVDLPIVVQDYPPISGFAMEAGLLARIAQRSAGGAHDQARGSADAVQDRAHSRRRRRHEGGDSRRARRRVPASKS